MRISVSLAIIVLLSSLMPGRLMAQTLSDADDRLGRGDVIVSVDSDGTKKYMAGHVMINAPPAVVWPIMANPFEFREHISPRLKQVEVLIDRRDLSKLKMTLDCRPLPSIYYVVESKYTNNRVDFHSVGGMIKEFSGSWTIAPTGDGKRCVVTYRMFIDPGLPVPQWVIRQGIGIELPNVLKKLRGRVTEVFFGRSKPEPVTINAATSA